MCYLLLFNCTEFFGCSLEEQPLCLEVLHGCSTDSRLFCITGGAGAGPQGPGALLTVWVWLSPGAGVGQGVPRAEEGSSGRAWGCVLWGDTGEDVWHRLQVMVGVLAPLANNISSLSACNVKTKHPGRSHKNLQDVRP